MLCAADVTCLYEKEAGGPVRIWLEIAKALKYQAPAGTHPPDFHVSAGFGLIASVAIDNPAQTRLQCS